VVDPARSGASLPGGFLPSAAPRPIDARTAVTVFVGAWLLAQVIASAIVVALHGTDTSVGPEFWVTAVALGGAWTTYLVAMWMTSQRAGSGSMIPDYGLSFRRVDGLGLGIGALGNLVLIRLVYLPLEAIWPETFTDDRLNENARELVDRAGGTSTVLLVAIVVVGAPLVEELFYRGLLQRPLASRFDETAVVVIVALVFALVHFRPIEIPGLFAIGLVFGVAALRTGRLGMAIMIHVGFNATGILRAL
jgi:uncharacterized protein